jgi:hypothetical protein
MKQVLLMIALALIVCLSAVGAARIAFNEETQADNGSEYAKVIEATIRVELKKPTGELTEADLAKVTSLNLNNTTAKPVKELTLEEKKALRGKVVGEMLREQPLPPFP